MMAGCVRVVSMTFRVVAIVFGGYALTAGCVALFGMALQAAGLPLKDAMLASVLLGYVFYVVVVMWAFADRRTLMRPVAVLGTAAGTMVLSSYLAPGALGT